LTDCAFTAKMKVRVIVAVHNSADEAN